QTGERGKHTAPRGVQPPEGPAGWAPADTNPVAVSPPTTIRPANSFVNMVFSFVGETLDQPDPGPLGCQTGPLGRLTRPGRCPGPGYGPGSFAFDTNSCTGR